MTIQEWQKEDPSRRFFLRKCTKPPEECTSIDEADESGDEDDNDETEIPTSPTTQKITPEDIGKRKSNFLFIHQEEWQHNLLKRYGGNIFLLDATYKTTKYNLPLFFVCVLTNSGYEIVGMIEDHIIIFYPIKKENSIMLFSLGNFNQH